MYNVDGDDEDTTTSLTAEELNKLHADARLQEITRLIQELNAAAHASANLGTPVRYRIVKSGATGTSHRLTAVALVKL